MGGASRILAYAVLIAACGLLIRYRWAALGILRRYFTEPGSPYDLACFRIFFFPAAFLVLHSSRRQDARLARLPRFLYSVPPGMHWAIHVVYFSPSWIHIASIIAIVTAITAAIGLLTRVSATLFLIAAGYLMTLPQLFGTGGHEHDLVWVAAIFAVSRSGDVLSVDAVRAALKRARQSESAAAPAPHVRYALPLRIIWLLMGLIYFFPGLNKYLHQGLKWASPANMSHLILGRQPIGSGWRAVVSGRYGWVLWAMGIGTLLFELSFVFLVLDRRTRAVAAGAGLIFHNMTNLIMSIPFWAVQILYVSFVPWQRLSHRIFERRGRLVVAYDPRAPGPLRSASVLQVTQLPDAVDCTSDPDDEAFEPELLRQVRAAQSSDGMCVIDRRQVLRGYDAYRRLSWRVPAAWPIVPLLYVPPVAKRLRAAISRRHVVGPGRRDAETPRRPTIGSPTVRRAGVLPVAIVGSILIVGVFSSGVMGVRDGWPFSMYPAFDAKPPVTVAARPTRTRVVLQFETVTRRGKRLRPSLDVPLNWLPAVRRYPYVKEFATAIARHPDRKDLVHAFWQSLNDVNGFLNHVARINFYRLVVSTAPKTYGRPLRRQLLATGRCVACAR